MGLQDSREMLKVLIVDDMPSMRGLIREGLEKSLAPVSCDEASDGREAQEKLKAGSYDLVLCDWIMPDVGGDELLQWMKNNDALSSVPFIMISTKGDKNSIIEAVRMGADDYVVKPFTVAGLAGKITQILGR